MAEQINQKDGKYSIEVREAPVKRERTKREKKHNISLI